MKNKISKEFIITLSKQKQEPQWMLDLRLEAFEEFLRLENPKFGPKLDINFDEIIYYKKELDAVDIWDLVKSDVKEIFDSLGVIKAEKDYLDGVSNQLESEVFYHQNKNSEVIFTSTDEALKKYPELVKKYFNTLVNFKENKYTALNTALWSGGSFIYVPKGVKVDRPLQSYFRINTASLGQFERTMIIVDDEASLSYIEGCTAVSYASSSLHAGVVEIFVGKNAFMRYLTIQNWSTDVYNLVTKRAIVDDYGKMEWVDGNIGSKVTMKYPACILKGKFAKGNSISIAYAKENQQLDAGAKMIHLGCNTTSNIISKSIASKKGVANYRGLTKITKKAINSRATIKCDTILLDDDSISDTFPKNIVSNDSSILEHEATVSKVNEDELFYLMSKGLSENAAKELIIMGFISEFKKELPMEYAVELNRLLKS